MDYGQFCPIAKATELLGERWMLLILRELFLGSHRYSDIQRGLSRISPSLLTKRLKELEQAGVVVRKSKQGRTGRDYYLTPAGKELAPLIENLAVWGMRWARGQLRDEELDVEFLMWDIQRRLQIDKLPEGETVFCFIFNDIERYNNWWVIVRDGTADLCTENPGLDVDLYIRSSLRAMVEIWEGDLALKAALQSERVTAHGKKHLAKTMTDWLGINPFCDIRPGDPELMRVAAV
ncbi:MAG: helix-turn-helix transcriptional regulator [Oceanospirillales bacterium]|uniref:winged helix-turn-helix transcriptional regulator n=1 Tax=Marinobacter maritimus TaxID=277961 RepID=UPI000BD2BBAA|nr:helix-turn-helix domain-containing protein [Marinobacter maritimus]MBL1271137.1 helix-turn-helix transcriptional regulator [Oceanospirillales bacterium]